jgi:tol-pal system protein YbgF
MERTATMITSTKSRIAAALIALSSLMPLYAGAGILDDDEARKAILDLRKKVETLSQELTARIEAKPDKSAVLELVNQHEQTLQEINKLRGQIEVVANQVATAQKQQKDLYNDIDARLRKLEPRNVSVDGQEAAVVPSEQQTYDAAYALFTGGNYKGAVSAMTSFVRSYPGSVYAPNAQYWLGNSYYMLNDYKNAIAVQEQLVASHRDSPKAPDALLNIASSYTALKDKKAAKKTLQELIAKYPGTSAAQAAKDRLAALK